MNGFSATTAEEKSRWLNEIHTPILDVRTKPNENAHAVSRMQKDWRGYVLQVHPTSFRFLPHNGGLLRIVFLA